jgi:hypothetical protein
MKIAGVTNIKELQALTMAQMLDAERKLFETLFGYSAFAVVGDGLPKLEDVPIGRNTRADESKGQRSTGPAIATSRTPLWLASG